MSTLIQIKTKHIKLTAVADQLSMFRVVLYIGFKEQDRRRKYSSEFFDRRKLDFFFVFKIERNFKCRVPFTNLQRLIENMNDGVNNRFHRAFTCFQQYPCRHLKQCAGDQGSARSVPHKNKIVECWNKGHFQEA